MTSYRRSASAPMEFHRSETDPMILQEWEEQEQAPKKKNEQDMSSPVAANANGDDKKNQTSDDVTATTSSMYTSSQNGSSSSFSKKCFCCNYQNWGRGIVQDYRRTVRTHWKSEMTNFSLQTVAVGFFLFFACIAPAITFGAIYAKATHNWIGAVEMIAATSWCGIVYALIGGQPMMINGGTGPVLAFTEILYSISVNLDIPFLTFNAWIGIWVCIYLIIAALIDLNKILKYCTKFTDEIFSFLISTIFIINAIGSPFAQIGVIYYFFPDHSSHEQHEDDPDYDYLTVALFSLMICIGTVQISFTLRKIKFSPYLFNQTARNMVTDFAVVTSIIIWTVVASVSGIQTETLNVPSTFAPTYACCDESCDTNWPDDCPQQEEPYGRRSWLVDLGDLNGKGWVPLMAAGPALLAFVLVFLDDGITWHLVNSPTHKLTHGSAYNYDTLLIGIMIAINSLLGLPWLVAATVRSLNHVHALAEKTPDGKIISVKETRLTGLFIHLLCLASIFALDVLKKIPVPVLYGVFLFMGLVSLGTNSFWNRICTLVMQPSKYPLEPYTVHVKPKRMHFYTLVQLLLFALLYVVKAIKAIAIAFPLIIACCIPIRLFILPRLFTEEELVMLDSDDATIKTWLSNHPEEMTRQEHEALVPKQEDDHVDDEAEDQQPPTPKHDDEEEEEHHDEDADQVTPLPDVSTERKRRHTKRRKSVSCPPHMLFAEVPLEATNVEISAVVEDEEEIPPPQEEEVTDEEMAMPPLRRRRRAKSVSCPPHMLFAEAQRQVASNYFFG